MHQWRRTEPGWRETVGAALVAAGVASASFYLARLFLAREPLPETPPPEALALLEGGGEEDEGREGPQGER